MGGGTGTGTEPHILYAECHNENYRLLRVVMGCAGFSVSRATSGTEVVKSVCSPNSGIDLLLTELRLEDMDGIKAVENIRAAGIKMPVIGLTTFLCDEDREATLRVGFDKLYVKPYDQDDLLKQITGYLR